MGRAKGPFAIYDMPLPAGIRPLSASCAVARMSTPNRDRFTLGLEFAGRVLFAALAFAYFQGMPDELWQPVTPLLFGGLVAYLVAQGVLLGRALAGRDAWWLPVTAALADFAAVLGVVVSDPFPAPPSLVLLLIVSLNLGMRQGLAAFAGALAGAAISVAIALQLRDSLFGVGSSYGLTYLLVFMLLCLLYFALLAFRRSALAERATRFADQDLETQLLNRRGFDSAARYLVPLHQRTQLPLVVLLASLDTRASRPLDAALLARAVREFGHAVRSRARRSDVVARLSDDEFVFMLFDTPPAGGEALARALVERLGAWSTQQGVDVRLTFGMINMPEEPVAIDQLIARARGALQRAQKHPSSPGVVTAQSL